MKGLNRKKSRGLGTRGSSMIYVIFLVTLLSIFSCGYMAISGYNMRVAVSSRKYMEAQLTAKTIHTSFSEAVGNGNSRAMNRLWELYGEDCNEVREEFEAMMDEEEEAAGEEAVWEASTGEEAAGKDLRDNTRFERYLQRALGGKEYVIHGRTVNEDEILVDITLRAKPMEECANVHTKVECNGYLFSMKADIVFDNRDNTVIDAPLPGNPRLSPIDGGEVYFNGNGVYRYYEDEASGSFGDE